MSEKKKEKPKHENSREDVKPPIVVGKVSKPGPISISDFAKAGESTAFQHVVFPTISSSFTIPPIDYSSITVAPITHTPIDISKIQFATFDSDLSSNYLSFGNEVAELRKQVDSQARALTTEKVSAQAKEERIAKLEATLEELYAKERLGFLLGRVNPAAQRELLRSDSFRARFVEEKETHAVVLSVDIRRSTELMLKARNPQAFAAFVTTLCADMMRIITDSFGVFDKFTGDGVLAFFPEFYGGPDAVFYAVQAADKCHESFREHYHRFRRSFTSVLTDIGLGIGLDYGQVHLVQIAGGLTVVGAPVVYACRLAGAPANVTLANQPAYEILSDRCASTCFVDETVLDIKHEGSMLAYAVRLNGREYSPEQPAWVAASPSEKKT